MHKTGLNEIRESYLKFFEGKGHLRLPSFPLVPQDDKSILLINAGMTPLKPYFTGQKKPPAPKVTTCQKCIRTLDIERVGKTSRHGTFFEMLGNFSFGDYFKKEAIRWAWEYVTGTLNLDRDKLWISIYLEDDEAFKIWNEDVGLPAERIVRLGKEDNFWEHGTGPCGPCSEIYYDRGANKGCGKPECAVGCDCDRYVEFWNLVFTEFYKEEDGSYSKLERKNIDTGMGLERIACVMQGVDSLFEVDTINRVLERVCETAGTAYASSANKDISLRIVTDHIRSSVMMISDGILPSNEGRGYVLRRLLRRAARHGRLLGIKGVFLYDVAATVIKESRDAYPELDDNREYIIKIIKLEEERFEATVDQGLRILEEFIEARECKTIPGSFSFMLHDTYGFPFDLTREIAEENGLDIDEQGFKEMMEQQRTRAREALKDKESNAWGSESIEGLDNTAETVFVGYNEFDVRAKVLHIVKDNAVAESADEGDTAVFILDRTPFYAEGGGQTADRGYLEAEGICVKVADCRKNANGAYLHTGIVERGTVRAGTVVRAYIDMKLRTATARNHTTTHLLQRALKNVLGEHINQAGSMVSENRIRFDFTHFAPLTGDEIKRVEDEVNAKILENLPVCTEEMDINEAKQKGAAALFGEKYGQIVRVVSVGDYSRELCGGTHLKTSAQAGLFKITGESGIASGVRRIEALTGEAALRYFSNKESLLEEIAGALKTSPGESLKRIESVYSEMKELQKQVEALRNELLQGRTGDMLSQKREINGMGILSVRIDGLDAEALRNTAEKLRGRIGSGVVVVGSLKEDKVSFAAMATADAVKKGIHSGNLIKEAARITGGGGGGRPDMAQAGGRDASRLDEALEAVYTEAEKQLVGA